MQSLLPRHNLVGGMCYTTVELYRRIKQTEDYVKIYPNFIVELNRVHVGQLGYPGVPKMNLK